MDENERLLLFADLLTYPSAVTARRISRLHSSGTLSGALAEFTAYAERTPLVHLQELYTSAFDLDPTCCPYIAYHLFGESFKRGALMAKLRETYAHHGFPVDGHELPDHVAVLLTFVADCADGALAAEVATELILPGVRKMAALFEGSSNPYGAVLRTLCAALEHGAPAVLEQGVLDV